MNDFKSALTEKAMNGTRKIMDNLEHLWKTITTLSRQTLEKSKIRDAYNKAQDEGKRPDA